MSPVCDIIHHDPKGNVKGKEREKKGNTKFLRALGKEKKKNRKRKIIDHLPLDCPDVPGAVLNWERTHGVSRNLC